MFAFAVSVMVHSLTQRRTFRPRRTVAAAVAVCLVAATLSACALTEDPPDSAEAVHSQVGAGGFRIDHDKVSVSADAGVADVRDRCVSCEC